MLRWFKPAVVGAASAAAIAALAGCSPAVLLNDWLVPQDGYARSNDIAYGDAPRQQLDVYRPWPGIDGKAPVIVFFYGGSWKGGQKSYYPFIGEAFTSRGFVVIIPDYRVYPDARFPTFIEDGARVLRWVRDNIERYGGDPQSILLVGHSAGAHIASMLLADKQYLRQQGMEWSAIRGFVGLAGPYAFDPLAYRSIQPIFAAASRPTMPYELIDGSEPPMLLVHGADDRTVYPVNSRSLAERSRRLGGRAEVLEVSDLGHIGVVLALAKPFRGDSAVFEPIITFLATHGRARETEVSDSTPHAIADAHAPSPH